MIIINGIAGNELLCGREKNLKRNYFVEETFPYHQRYYKKSEWEINGWEISGDKDPQIEDSRDEEEGKMRLCSH